MAAAYQAVAVEGGDAPLPPARLDGLFLRRLWRLIQIGFSDRTQVLLISLLALSVTSWQLLVYFVGILPSNFYRTILARDLAGFRWVLMKSLLLIGAVTLSIAAYKFLEGWVALGWRSALCNFLHERYLNRTMYYKLNVLDRKRITSDVDRFTQTFRSMITNLISSPLMIVYYTYLTWHFLGPLGPLYLFAYFVIGSLVSKWFMSPIVPLVEQQEKLEGNFRFSHVSVRTFAESVAFYRGEHRERAAVSDGLSSVVANSKKLMWRQLPLNMWTDFFAYVGAVMSYLLLAIPVFAGFFDDLFAKNDNGAEVAQLISQSAFASLMLIAGFTNLIQLAQSFSDLAGYTARICDLIERVEKLEKKEYEWGPATAWSGSDALAQGQWREGSTLTFKHATCTTPDGRVLVKDLSLELPRSRNLLIVGPSGSGKSSILRMLSELWPVLIGEITKPNDNIFFVPQVPYLGRGTLRDLLLYPDDSRPALDDELIELLSVVQLQHLLQSPERLANVAPWTEMLSPGEQQRLSIARMLLRRPTYAVLDESTSAIDVDVEARLYATFRQRGITVISVGHRPSLRAYHDILLELDAHGGWRVTELTPSPLESISTVAAAAST